MERMASMVSAGRWAGISVREVPLLIFVLVVIKVGGSKDFSHQGGLRRFVAQNGAFHFLAINKFFNEDFPSSLAATATAASSSDSLWTLLTPTEEPALAGFDENWIAAQPVCDFLAHRFLFRLIIYGIEREKTSLWNGKGVQQQIGEHFIHADGGGQSAAADVWDAAELEQTLNGAVLAVFAVKHRENTSVPARFQRYRRF